MANKSLRHLGSGTKPRRARDQLDLRTNGSIVGTQFGGVQSHACRVETGRVADMARPRTGDLPDLKAMLAPYPSEDMISWPVSTRVGNVKNNDPTLIEPIAAV